MTKRCLELLRVSTAEQATESHASLPAQRAVNRRTAAAYGLTIVRSIEMSDVSGAAVLLAPEIKELVTLMNDPEIHGVIAREFSRLMRPENFSDYALLQAFADSNTILYLPEGPIDFASKTGRLMGTIRAAIAGMERTEILERIWSAKEEKRKAGGFAQSKVCLPYGVDFHNRWAYTGDAERVREAFRLILSGNASYSSVGRQVGIDVYSLRVILRNPIYTGWRIIDKKRDLSPTGKYKTKDGRQGDRRKIARAPEDVIRVKVLEPLISESEFNQVQRILDLKKSHHWRTREGYESRFTYRGLLLCSICEGLIYTKYRRADYYVCKARHIGHTCIAGYMRREKLEPELDSLFAEKLTSARFLKQVERDMKQARPQVNTERIETQIQSLVGKRERVLESYFEGVINGTERDLKLAEIEREKKIASDLLTKQRPDPQVDARTLAKVFGTFVRFKRLKTADKRRLLTSIAPEILVANYRIKGLFLAPESLPIVPNRFRTEMGHFKAEGDYGAVRLYLPLEAA